MDADDLEPLRARVLELVRRVRPDDEDVARAGHNLLPVGREPRRSGPDDPRLGIGVPVQVGACTGLVVHQEEGDAGAMLPAFEPKRPAWAPRDLAVADDSVHHRACIMRIWFPDGSRKPASIPYGCSIGSCVNSTPRPFSSSYVAWTSSDEKNRPLAAPLATRAST